MFRTVVLATICFANVVSFSSVHPRRWNRSRTLLLHSSTSGSSNADIDPTADLTSTLARLDDQWRIQQTSLPRSRWTTLVLPKDDEEKKMFEEKSFPTGSVMMTPDYCYLLEPPENSVPSCLIVFTGGAGLGTYPQIAYNEFLLRLSNRLNAAVITAPYQVGLDHFTLARVTGDLTRRAIVHCQDDPSRQYPENLPTFSLSHSLGCKLSCIYITATEQCYDGIGYISFNNFSFAATISMAKEFAEVIRKNAGYDTQASGISSEAINTLFNFAEMAIAAVGIDFSPSQQDMERLMKLKYDEKQRRKTRFFSFDDDMLENTQDALIACDDIPSVSGLPGTHLTPVYFELGIEDVELPDDVKEMTRNAMGGLRNISFGNNEELEALVSEVCDWIMGKKPSRPPKWQNEKPQLVAQSDSTV
jgi:Protein of unknown function (DUF1350)